MQKQAGCLILLGAILAAPVAWAGGPTPRLMSLKQHMWASEIFAEEEAREVWWNAESRKCHALRRQGGDAERVCRDRLQVERDRRECERHERWRVRHGEIFAGSPVFNLPLPGHCSQR